MTRKKTRQAGFPIANRRFPLARDGAHDRRADGYFVVGARSFALLAGDEPAAATPGGSCERQRGKTGRGGGQRTDARALSGSRARRRRIRNFSRLNRKLKIRQRRSEIWV